MRGGLIVLLHLCAAGVSTSPFSQFSSEEEEFESLVKHKKYLKYICQFY